MFDALLPEATPESTIGEVSLGCEHLSMVGGDRDGERKLELAEVLRVFAPSVSLTPHQQRVVGAIIRCRTAALGSHARLCDACGYREAAYNSCRNRHCPKCQGLDEVRWLEGQQRYLLPVTHHHVVLTVAEQLLLLFVVAPRVAYDLLFAAVAETLQEVAAREKNLGGRIGISAILHTWTQLLRYHPHLHCIVPGGGLSFDGSRWVPAGPRFLFSIEVLKRVFRGKLLNRLESASKKGEIPLPASQVRDLLCKAAKRDWCVYSKPAMGGPEHVLRYLGRYTHRIAISNSRLVEMNDGEVTFRWRDRADGNQVKLETLPGEEFVRRFVQHIVPPAFRRIRHYGLHSNSTRKTMVSVCRELLSAPPPPEPPKEESWWELYERVTGEELPRCLKCGEGRMIHEATRPRSRAFGRAPPRPPPEGLWN